MKTVHTVHAFPGFCVIFREHADGRKEEVCKTPDGIDAAKRLALTLDTHDEMRAALVALVEAHDEEPKTLTAAEWDAARAAIAKAKGGAL